MISNSLRRFNWRCIRSFTYQRQKNTAFNLISVLSPRVCSLMGQRGSKISRDQLTKYLQKRGSNVLYVAHQNRDVKVIRLMFMGTMAATLFLTWNVKETLTQSIESGKLFQNWVYKFTVYGMPAISFIIFLIVAARLRSYVCRMEYMPKSDAVLIQCETVLGLKYRSLEVSRTKLQISPKVANKQISAKIDGHYIPFTLAVDADFNDTVLYSL
ncbi:uncharacterized protein LOC134845546 [Symsagittifera roscoffensis]|uniref:uncharacterized protein LOC134845546 n=1 Tax=Symsagittifera roscoffensis TaxID=84072 RepID=UPI00307C5797